MVIDKIIVKCRYISYENKGHKCVEVYNQAAHHFLRYVDKNTMQWRLKWELKCNFICCLRMQALEVHS